MKLKYCVSILFLCSIAVLFISGCANKPIMPPTSPSCTNECAKQGMRQCYGEGYKICDNYNSDSCMEWSNVTACSEGTKCIDGACIKKPNLGQKIDVLSSGDYRKKLDILFIPQNISDMSSVNLTISKVLFNEKGAKEGAGLFNTEPFNNYQDKFNVFYVDKNLDTDYFNCILQQQDTNKLQWQLHQFCDTKKIEEEYKLFNPDYIIILFDLPEGYSSSGGEIQNLEIDRPNVAWTFVHEFAHQFGGLVDEYTTTDSPSRNCGGWDENVKSIGNRPNYNCFEDYAKAIAIYPNLDTLGCPKWCASYDVNKLLEENSFCGAITNEQDCASKSGGGVCTWFKIKNPFLNSNCVMATGFENIGIDCIDNSKCVFGGDYGQLAFNPGISIMSGGIEFNVPSKNHLSSILECCYPRKNTEFCDNFRNKFNNLPESVTSYFKISYEKILDCE